MKRNLFLLYFMISLLLFTSCGQRTAGAESSLTGMNDVTKCKVTANTANVTLGCANNAPVLQSVTKNTKLDVLGKVANWYAVKLPNGKIGFILKKLATPILSDKKPTNPGTTNPGTTTNPGSTPSGTGNPADNKTQTPNTGNINNSTLTDQEKEMVNLVNKARAQNNLPALKVDIELTKVARLKAQDMIDNKYFSHNSPKYGSPFDMMKSFGINYMYAGENIAGNQTVQRAHDALMNSPGHRANILSKNYTHIGIGIRKGGPYGYMFSQMFISKPQ